ncbi:hypothetical protein, partial [Agrobacterium tumefaciens]|uniref:hypothetical protein n=1 Tax=Agrobacterium tumefaciens TaxID=358 RepID=UPI001BA64A41
ILPNFDVGGMAGMAINRSLPFEKKSGPCRTALLFRCGLNRRPVVSRPLSRRVAADPTSLREGRLAVCSGQNLLARKPVLLVQPDRTFEAARPLPVLVVRIEGQSGTVRIFSRRARNGLWPCPPFRRHRS